MRQDFQKFTARDVEIIAIGPDGPNAFRRYWEEEQLPFTGCADVGSKVAAQFDQKVNWLKFGRMPAEFIIDRDGTIRYFHYGDSMSDIPGNAEILDVIETLQAGQSAAQSVLR